MRIQLAVGTLILAQYAGAQVSPSAYRVLGQPDLRQNGLNLVQGSELRSPGGVALDTRDGATHLYVADTQNHRVLAWRSAAAYQAGDTADLILGQASPRQVKPLGIGNAGFDTPLGLAVEPASGDLYVADSNNHRVLRFPSPFRNTARVEPDAVYGQPDFTRSQGLIVSAAALNRPLSVAFDAAGNLWVVDSGHHRVLRFAAASLSRAYPDADIVLGQKDFTSGAANRGTGTVSGAGFDTPWGSAFDAQGNLYVSDFNNSRVLKFAAPIGPGSSGAVVLGQRDFSSRVVPAQASADNLRGPSGLTVGGDGRLYVVMPAENRVLSFVPNAISGTAADTVWGQVDFTSTQANPASYPYASASTFSAPTDVKTDAAGSLYIADSGNHRVLQFPPASKSAASVWGQTDFTGNGANQVKPASINTPYKMAVDYSQAPYALYISDTNNHRVLGWRDAVRFRSGDPADLVIGQPDLRTALPNVDGHGVQPSRTSLYSPRGIAVDADGNLWVADSGNHRLLRYPRPTAQSGRIAPDAVLGQANFEQAVSAAVSATSLRSPAGVAIAPSGAVFVADSGNNRVLEYAAGAVTGASAVRVYGQPDFRSATAPSSASAQTLSSPQGVFVDGSLTLYVADTGAHRIMIFPNTADAPAAGMAASIVIGQDRFDVSGSSSLRNPVDVAVDSLGRVYVSDNGNNRVLQYSSLLWLPLAGARPETVVGQREVGGTSINWNSPDDLATPESLYAPLGIFIDRMDTLYVGDSGNNRVLHFLRPAALSQAASSQTGAPLARGTLAVLQGSSLSGASEKIETAPYARVLAGRELVVNDDIRAPLSSITPERIEFQMPSLAPLGSGRLALRSADTGELVAGAAIMLVNAAPGLFSGRILNQDGSVNSTSNPAAKGSSIKIFGTGQGPLSPFVADGEAGPADPAAATVAVPTSDLSTCLNRQPSVCVSIGNSVFGDISFSGLAPGSVGLWQLTVKLPTTAPAGGAVQVRAMIHGAPTNFVTVAIQ